MPTKEAPAEAEIALAISECMNLLFLFAAPRVLTAVRRSGGGGLDGPASLASLRRFLHQAAGIRARATTRTDDVDRLVRAAMVVEEIAGTMGASAFSDPLPLAIVAGSFGWARVLDHPAWQDPKVLATIAVWVVYAFGLSLYYFRGWRGIRCVGITLVAFVLMILSSWIVPLLLGSAHGVSGLS